MKKHRVRLGIITLVSLILCLWLTLDDAWPELFGVTYHLSVFWLKGIQIIVGSVSAGYILYLLFESIVYPFGTFKRNSNGVPLEKSKMSEEWRTNTLPRHLKKQMKGNNFWSPLDQ